MTWICHRACRGAKGRFKKCGSGGRKRRKGACKFGRTKAGTCRKRRKRAKKRGWGRGSWSTRR